MRCICLRALPMPQAPTAPRYRIEVTFSPTASIHPYGCRSAFLRKSLLLLLIRRAPVSVMRSSVRVFSVTPQVGTIPTYRPTRTTTGLAGSSVVAVISAKAQASAVTIRIICKHWLCRRTRKREHSSSNQEKLFHAQRPQCRKRPKRSTQRMGT
jgi:hypothetical protein